MSHQTPANRVFFHVLEGNEYAFSDERTRTYLLNIMRDTQKQSEWQIYAFCMTNKNVYFVIEARSLALLDHDLACITEQFREECRALLPKWWSDAIRIKVGKGRRLTGKKRIKDCCCQLHQLPLQYGYVERIADYWWSSYVTYAGIYDWRLVDCSWLLLQFCDQPLKARQQLKDYHQLQIYHGGDLPAFTINNV